MHLIVKDNPIIWVSFIGLVFVNVLESGGTGLCRYIR